MKKVGWILVAAIVLLTGCCGIVHRVFGSKEYKRIRYASVFQQAARENPLFEEITVQATGEYLTVFEISGGSAARTYAVCAREDSTYFNLKRIRRLGFKEIHIKDSSNDSTLYIRRL